MAVAPSRRESTLRVSHVATPSAAQVLWPGRAARGLTLDAVWLALPPLVCLLLLDLATIPPNDFWWHLRTGQIIAETRVIPNVDLFTFTRSGMPWINQSWLMEVFLFLVYQVGGLPLVLFSHALSITAGYVLLQAACLRVVGGQARTATLAVIAAAMLGLINWTVRPQSVSFACFGALIYVLERSRERDNWLAWWLPALFALWSNLHGGFVFGLGLLGVYTASRVVGDLRAQHSLTQGTRRFIMVTVASVAALALNPSGLVSMAGYVLGFFRSNATQNMNVEFMALSLRQPDGILFLIFVGLLALILYGRRLHLPPYYLAAAVAFGAFSLYSRRVVPWFGMAAAPGLAWALAQARPAAVTGARRGDRPVLNLALLLTVAAATVLSFPWFRPGLALPAERRGYLAPHTTPVAAAEALCALDAPVRAFAEIGYASYLSWACPNVSVFIDTRFELYPTPMWEDYLAVGDARYGWENKLAGYGVDAILARKSEQASLVEAARASAAWRVLYEDEDSLLAVRADASLASSATAGGH